jgi:hypothetical protein
MPHIELVPRGLLSNFILGLTRPLAFFKEVKITTVKSFIVYATHRMGSTWVTFKLYTRVDKPASFL